MISFQNIYTVEHGNFVVKIRLRLCKMDVRYFVYNYYCIGSQLDTITDIARMKE